MAVDLLPDREGRWGVTAEWDGRGLAGLWLYGPDGAQVGKRVGASPLTLEIDIGARAVAGGGAFRARFRPMTGRGALSGLLVWREPPLPDSEVIPGPEPAAAAGRPPCLGGLPAGESATRALAAVAERLAAVRSGGAWLDGWLGRVEASLPLELSPAARREVLDELWTRLAAEPPAAEADGRALRSLLAALEDLTRREPGSERARTLQETVCTALACLREEHRR